MVAAVLIQRSRFGEMAFAVVEKNICAVAHGVDDQIQIAVAVDVGKGRAGASASMISDAGCLGDALEFPIPEIAIENVVAVDAAEIKVAPAIAVHIPAATPEPFRKI